MHLRQYSQLLIGFATFLIGVFLLSYSIQSFSADPAAPKKIAVAQVVWVKGSMKAIGEDKVSRTLQRRGVIYEHDTIVTAANGSGEIVFTDNTIMSMRPNTEIKIDKYKFTKGAPTPQDQYIVDVAKGGFRTITGAIAKSNPSSYQVNTPVATIGVRGTQWSMVIKGQKSFFKIESGEISVKTEKGDVTLNPNTPNMFATVDAENPVPQTSSTPPPAAGDSFSSANEPSLTPATSTLSPDGSSTGPPDAPSGPGGGAEGGPTGDGGSSSGGEGSATGDTTSTSTTVESTGSSGGGSSQEPVSGFCIQ